jgi:antitoxin (DNA-binding transcriptional repressor) of toxin-antitoxin stability system
MQFVTIRELSKSPKEALSKIKEDNKAVLTNNGKPQALIFKIDENGFEKTLSMLQKLEFMQNLTAMRQTSMKNGNSKMTIDEINAEINAVRKKRKGKS